MATEEKTLAFWQDMYRRWQNGMVTREYVSGMENMSGVKYLVVYWDLGREVIKGMIFESDIAEGGSPRRFIGRSIPVVIKHINRSANEIYLSHRAALEQMAEQTWSKLEPGQVQAGCIEKILPGKCVLVNIGGVTAVMPLDEVRWGWAGDIKTYLVEGQDIEVLVKEVDRENRRVVVSRKALLPDPWLTVDSKYREGGQYAGEVTNITQTAVYVSLEPGVDAVCRTDRPDNIRPGGRVVILALNINHDKRLVIGRLLEGQQG